MSYIMLDAIVYITADFYNSGINLRELSVNSAKEIISQLNFVINLE